MLKYLEGAYRGVRASTEFCKVLQRLELHGDSATPCLIHGVRALLATLKVNFHFMANPGHKIPKPAANFESIGTIHKVLDGLVVLPFAGHVIPIKLLQTLIDSGGTGERSWQKKPE